MTEKKTSYSCAVAESTTVTLPDVELFKKQALQWANHFRVICLLDSNGYAHDKYSSREWVLAIDALSEIRSDESLTGGKDFEKLKEFQQAANAEIFGFLGYDLKNEIETLASRNCDGLKFPELNFFKPRYIIELKGNKVTVNRNYPETFELLERLRAVNVESHDPKAGLKLKARTGRDSYLANIEKIKQQIVDGDFYEMNYCNEFYSEHASIRPVETFLRLNEKAKAPFSCFFKLNHKFLLCASPERFLKRVGEKLISQPIKGTIKKGASAEENEALKANLKNDAKERAENIMIVDLVRNDLAHSSKPGSVKVEELCGVYEFNTVNQMISTVTSELEIDPVEAIKHAFPMGSMTGAPKIEVMKNIEAYEDFKRGLYSGSVGYFTASSDFDFNVVIRSIFYNSSDKYLSVRAGGAITYDSVAENEWKEVLLKAQGMIDVLEASIEE
jgi:para-aminobenzoate synthetase component 1